MKTNLTYRQMLDLSKTNCLDKAEHFIRESKSNGNTLNYLSKSIFFLNKQKGIFWFNDYMEKVKERITSIFLVADDEVHKIEAIRNEDDRFRSQACCISTKNHIAMNSISICLPKETHWLMNAVENLENNINKNKN